MGESGKILEFMRPRRYSEIREEGPDSVEIINVFDPDKPPRVLARCRLVGGEVKFEGDEDFIKNLLQEDFSLNGKLVSPKDGREFLEAIKVKYRNPYLLGRDVK
jgi:hypothetical protein